MLKPFARKREEKLVLILPHPLKARNNYHPMQGIIEIDPNNIAGSVVVGVTTRGRELAGLKMLGRLVPHPQILRSFLQKREEYLRETSKKTEQETGKPDNSLRKIPAINADYDPRALFLERSLNSGEISPEEYDLLREQFFLQKDAREIIRAHKKGYRGIVLNNELSLESDFPKLVDATHHFQDSANRLILIPEHRRAMGITKEILKDTRQAQTGITRAAKSIGAQVDDNKTYWTAFGYQFQPTRENNPADKKITELKKKTVQEAAKTLETNHTDPTSRKIVGDMRKAYPTLAKYLNYKFYNLTKE